MTKQCSWCERVWSDVRGTWTRFHRPYPGETTHGLCPDCLQALIRAHGLGTPKFARRR